MAEGIHISAGTKNISGTLQPVSSKSESNRALIIQALCKEEINILNLSQSDDTCIMQKLLEQIKSGDNKELNVHHAGTVMRFLTAYLAPVQGEFILTGSERMQQRPVKELVNTLVHLGAQIQYLNQEGFPPILIKGKKLKGGKTSIHAGTSSQFISALMLSAPYFENGLELSLTGNKVSEPYIKMTASLMREFGVEVNLNENHISVPVSSYKGGTYTIESDWSAASYFYSLAALSQHAKITLKGFLEKSMQGDSVLKEIYQVLGVTTTFISEGIQLEKTHAAENYFEYNFIDCPDIAQTVAVTCAGLGISAKLNGLQTLKIKETDRLSALQNELKKFNVAVEINDSELHIAAGKMTNPVQPVKTYDDHRMAMCFAPLALLCPLSIENPGVVSKSYPLFWEHLQKLGIIVQNSDI